MMNGPHTTINNNKQDDDDDEHKIFNLYVRSECEKSNKTALDSAPTDRRSMFCIPACVLLCLRFDLPACVMVAVFIM